MRDEDLTSDPTDSAWRTPSSWSDETKGLKMVME